MENWSQRLSQRFVTRHDVNLEFFIVRQRLSLEFPHVFNIFLFFLKFFLELTLMLLPSLIHIKVECFGLSDNWLHGLSRLSLSMQLLEIRHWLGVKRC
jgi:hypothetical protein